MRDHRRRVFLEIVRREHMVPRRDEGLEEMPGPARDQAQRLRVRGGDRRQCRFRRQADPARDGRRDEPKHDERRRHRPRIRRGPRDERPCPGRQRNPTGHLAIESEHIEPWADLRLSGCDPLKQVPTRDDQTVLRPHDRFGHGPRLVREKCHQEHNLRQRELDVRADRPKMDS